MSNGFLVPYTQRLDLNFEGFSDGDLTPLFRRLQPLPNCVWLDSASDRSNDRGRYSFLSADPVAWCCADTSAPDPWPVLQEWCRKLSRHAAVGSPDLPPFCGGIVALLAYEASWWLEPSLRRLAGELGWPTNLPGMAIGLYDWTIAIDHHRHEAWLLSTGIDETFQLDADRAARRAAQVLRWIAPPDAEDIAVSQPFPVEDLGHPTDNPASPGPPEFLRQSVASNFNDSTYADGVAEIILRIRRGDSFQVNLAQTLSHPATCSPADLFESLRRVNPAPYSCFFDAGHYAVVSSSPEGFLQVRTDAQAQRVVTTRPIKGTVARTGNAETDTRLGTELLASEKDRAENIMIVDLMRNDLSRVCTDDSVEVTGLCELERYQRVQHLVSTVRGVLTPDATICDLLAACFPGGSITGAPKIEAMRTIATLECRPRGPYCGSLGYISLTGAADFNILIRTITHRKVSGDDRAASPLADPAGSVWEFPVGGGITALSDPQRETQETWVKAASLLEAIATPR